MKIVKNILERVNGQTPSEQTSPVSILNEQSKAINDVANDTNIWSEVFSISKREDGEIKEMKHVLYLFPKNGNDYNYRFIEISTNLDLGYPIQVYAYQAGNTNFGECKDEKEFSETLEKIFDDPRLKIIFTQLKNIGNTIEDWTKNREK